MNYLFQHKDFEDLLNQTANALNLPFDFVEKDYWVTYILFRMKKAGIDDFVFKGGTSLTKGWQLLDRFSEDIDLLFYPSSVTKDKKRSRLDQVKSAVSKFDGLTYNKEKSGSYGHYRDACFEYDRKKTAHDTPLLPHIKLEMGYRGNADKFEHRMIQSYVGRQIELAGKSDLSEDIKSFEVPILDINRTFVEKLFAIHTAFENNQVSQYYRHYYDVYKLIDLDNVNQFYGTSEFDDIAQDVASKSSDFPNTKIPIGCNFKKSNAFKAEKSLITQIDSALRLHGSLFSKVPPSAKSILEKLETIIYR